MIRRCQLAPDRCSTTNKPLPGNALHLADTQIYGVQKLFLDSGRAGRTAATPGEPRAMPRVAPTLHEPDLERELLRKGVGALAADRCSCADCGRTPLVGEHVHVYERGIVVCELCRLLRRAAPQRSELVRHSEHGHTVRLRRAA